MKNRFVYFKNKKTGNAEQFKSVKDVYRKYGREFLCISYNSLMNVLAREKKYSNNIFSICYKQKICIGWK